HVYAESIIVPDRLGERIRTGLLEAKKPLGLLINEERLETYREILSCDLEKAEEISEHFNIAPDANLISRTYRVFAHQQPVMLITEKFPETAFK
ncbi:MAG: chorismate pyruvate-lyase family protein, partial [Gammaproteobacteria bacterium]|nr:chorismate pyruvate-lyase family protein [Gammaproteobacteria bacterium]